MPSSRKFGLGRRTGWEISLWQRGSKTSLGRNSYGCGISLIKGIIVRDRQIDVRRHIAIACYLLVGFYLLTALYLLSGLTGPGRFYRSGIPAGADFLQIWGASSLASRGNPASVYDVAELKKAETVLTGGDFSGNLPWHYPPSFLLLILPISSLNYFASLAAWLFIPLVGLLAILYRIFPDRLTIWLALASIAVANNLYFGQGAFLITFLMGAGLLLLDCYPILGGIFFCLIINFKPHLGLLIPVALLAGRKWRALGSLAGASAVLVLASTWVLGLNCWMAFWNDIPQMRMQLAESGNLWNRMPTVYGAIRLLGGGYHLAWTVQILVALGAVISVYWVWRNQASLPIRGSSLVLGTLLATPHAIDYDLVLLLLPIAWMAWEGLNHHWGKKNIFVLAIVWLSPFMNLISARIGKVHLMPIIIGSFMIYLLARAGGIHGEQQLSPANGQFHSQGEGGNKPHAGRKD
ncbi:MAG: glycosyltransferase family 87 protein [Desulfobaccales bacterium]